MRNQITTSIKNLKDMLKWFETEHIELKIPELQREYVWGPVHVYGTLKVPHKSSNIN